MADTTQGNSHIIESCWQTGKGEQDLGSQQDKTSTTQNPCRRVLPGSTDCRGQIEKSKCVFQQVGEHASCAGLIHSAGANTEQAKHFFRVKRLEDYRSTEQGLGHLSNKRALHSSPVPLRE
jgi:hypothetical protein